MYGYIKLSRKVFDGCDDYWPTRRKFSPFEAWVDLLQMACWGQSKVNGVSLARGQVLVSTRFLAERWRWTRSKVFRWIFDAQKANRLTEHQTGQEGTVYLIVNYDTYQSTDSKSGTPRETPSGTQTGHLRDTYGTKTKEVKEVKNKEYVTEFEKLWPAWKGKTGNSKQLGLDAYSARRKAGVAAEHLANRTRVYYNYCKARGELPPDDGGKYMLHTKTFFGPNLRYDDDWGDSKPKRVFLTHEGH